MKFFNRIPWTKLSPNQKTNRNLSLEILRNMRKGNSLTASSKEIGLPFRSAKKFLGRNVLKKGGRWKPTKTDSIQRAMQIYEKGEIKTIIVTNSKDAKLIGEYFNAVRHYLETGDTSYLKKFKRITITDAYGKKHKLETNPKKIRKIEDMKEDSEFWEIYSNE